MFKCIYQFVDYILILVNFNLSNLNMDHLKIFLSEKVLVTFNKTIENGHHVDKTRSSPRTEIIYLLTYY